MVNEVGHNGLVRLYTARGCPASNGQVKRKKNRWPQRPTWTTDLYKYSPDAVPPIHAVSYHVATDKPPAQNDDKFLSILATVYNQSQLAEKKHVAHYWSINTAATAVRLSPLR